MEMIPVATAEKMPEILQIFLETVAGITDKKTLRALIPSQATLAGTAVDMQNIGRLHVAETVVKATNTCLIMDGSNKNSRKYRSALYGVNGEKEGDAPIEVFNGFEECVSGRAEDEAATIITQLEKTQAVYKAMHEDNPAMGDKINIAMFTDGTMTDHAGGESAAIDVIEQRIKEHFINTIPGFIDKTEEEKIDMVRLHRGFCFEHKIDNLCKEACLGMSKWAI